MINIDTLKFVWKLNDLAEKTAKGFLTFSECPGRMADRTSCVVYDDTSYVPGVGYRVLDNMCAAICDLRHAEYIDSKSWCFPAQIGVDKDGDGDLYVAVKFQNSEEEIIIENGRWYFLEG